RLMAARDVALREVEPVEHLALAEDRGLGRVEVLRALVVVGEAPRPEADGRARDVADRPDEPAADPVVAAPLPLAQQPGTEQLGLGEAATARGLLQRLARGGREAHAEALRGREVEPALSQEALPERGGGRDELLAEVCLSRAARLEQAQPAARLLL